MDSGQNNYQDYSTFDIITKTFANFGVILDQFNEKNGPELFLSIPKDAYYYHEDNGINCAKDIAKNIKFFMYGLLNENVIVKYKEYDAYFTKEMANQLMKKQEEDNRIIEVIESLGIL